MLVSVLMCVYNGERYIRNAIDSVLDQTYDKFEFIIVDDGSEDLSSEILHNYKIKESRIRIISKQHTGLVKSLNIGLSECKGTLIARIDADDIWLHDKIRLQVIRFEKDVNLYMLGTSKRDIDISGNIYQHNKYPRIFSYQDIKDHISKRNIFCHSSVMYRKEVLSQIGCYNEDYIN